MVRNPHLLTIAANFANRRLDVERFPVECKYYQTEPGTQVLVHSHRPPDSPRGEILFVHGLEGSSNAGYIRSMSQLALEAGYVVHRTNMRSCGGTDSLSDSMYHAGLTSDTLFVLREIRRLRALPIYLVGYSLGGNVALKLAGELGAAGQQLLSGVCAVSTPIDLAACVRKMGEPQNRIYESRFLSRLKERMVKRASLLPPHQTVAAVRAIRTVYDFDDRITAQIFGFGSADNYYSTQSSIRFLHGIRVPTLIVQAKDDPLIPFAIFNNPVIAANPHIEMLAVDHGGHLGFIANRAPRFWLDRVLLEWIQESAQQPAADSRVPQAAADTTLL